MEMLEDLKVESTKKKIKRRIGKEEWIQRLLIIGMILAFFDYASIAAITIVYTSFL
ncbi:putative iron compound ABC transporter, permease protein [Bacillus cereus AH187]|uniref:Iron compound ABC transporter, permease protein n=1 Tax=Bacillus cereus (strain AH187) TaxID=405534 RepID=B7I0N0_BACC7|nr:putative iron compound ABC transporter, permease protein [Bacillus cereus AH187]